MPYFDDKKLSLSHFTERQCYSTLILIYAQIDVYKAQMLNKGKGREQKEIDNV
jgi:hypothetical protein